MLNASVGLDVGFAALGNDSDFIATFPVGAKFYLVPKNGSFYLAGGGGLLTAQADSGPFDSAAKFYGYAGIGFEHRANTGFIFSFAAYSLFAEGEFFIWPGLAFGYAF